MFYHILPLILFKYQQENHTNKVTQNELQQKVLLTLYHFDLQSHTCCFCLDFVLLLTIILVLVFKYQLIWSVSVNPMILIVLLYML